MVALCFNYLEDLSLSVTFLFKRLIKLILFTRLRLPIRKCGRTWTSKWFSLMHTIVVLMLWIVFGRSLQTQSYPSQNIYGSEIFPNIPFKLNKLYINKCYFQLNHLNELFINGNNTTTQPTSVPNVPRTTARISQMVSALRQLSH